MTYNKVANGLLVGTSSDTKPTTYADKTIFYETDTGAWYVSTTGSWAAASGPTVSQTLSNKTISGSSNTITNIGSTSLPATTVYTGQANTFGAFDQTFPSSHFKVLNPAGTFAYTLAGSAITAARTITWPLLTANDQITTDNDTTTLTNKTIDTGSNTITNIANTNVSSSAAIAYSKLNLSGSVVNSDIGTSAAIAWSKISKTGSAITDIANVVITSPSSGQVLTYNGTNWINQAVSGGGFTEAKGSSTKSGNASTTAFTQAHGLSGTPTYYTIQPTSADATSDYYLGIDATNITVNYLFPPPTGTSNVTFVWRAAL